MAIVEKEAFQLEEDARNALGEQDYIDWREVGYNNCLYALCGLRAEFEFPDDKYKRIAYDSGLRGCESINGRIYREGVKYDR